MKNFTIQELVHSNTATRLGIDNTPTEEEMKNMENLIDLVLDPLREEVGKPIIVTSGYRCLKLNEAVGSKPNSQHMAGLAADLVCHRLPVQELFRIAKEMSERDFIWCDQLILEYNQWVHISTAQKPRRQYFSIG